MHARPAALFVQIANKFDSRITVRRDDEKEEVNGKSIMGILMLGAERGSIIVIEIEGDEQEEGAMAALEKIITDEGE